MSKHSVQMRHMMRSPKAMMEFQVSGKLPRAIEPKSPLIDYLESIPPTERSRMKGVKLSPELGYQSNAIFDNAEQLLRYLKPNDWVVGIWPARSRQIAGFSKVITNEIFNRVQGS